MNFQPSDFEKVPCDLCGADDTTLRYSKRGFSIVQCNKCGMVYTNPRLTGGKIAELYDADYFQGHGFDKSVDYVGDLKIYDKKPDEYTLNDWDLDTIKSMLVSGVRGPGSGDRGEESDFINKGEKNDTEL